MLKICMITSNLLPVPNVKGGAIESLITNIIHEQEKYKKIDLTIVSIYDKQAYLKSLKFKNTNFIYIKKNIKYILYGILYNISNRIFKTEFNTYNKCVLDKIKKKKFDYIIAEGGHYNSYFKFLKYYDRKQLILHLHHQEKGNSIMDKTFSRVIGVSNFVTDHLVQSSNNIKGYCLRNGIKLENFNKKLSYDDILKIRKKCKFNKNDFVVLFSGRLIREKGILELVKAIKNIDNKNIKLIILGKDPFNTKNSNHYIDELYKEVNGNEDRIKFAGYINYEDIYKYYAMCNIVCVPSVWEDAAPIVCLEAMMSKKIILATESGGIPEHLDVKTSIIVSKNTNIINNLEKGIIDLYNKRNELKDLGEKAFIHGKQFNSLNMYNNLIELLELFYKEDNK